jgi:hypothetical protein
MGETDGSSIKTRKHSPSLTAHTSKIVSNFHHFCAGIDFYYSFLFYAIKINEISKQLMLVKANRTCSRLAQFQ